MSYNCTPHEDIANLGVSVFKVNADAEAINGAAITSPWATGRYQVFILSADEATADLTVTVKLQYNSGAGAGSWADYVDDDGNALTTAALAPETGADTVNMFTVDLERLNVTDTTEYNAIRVVATVADGTTADGISIVHYTTGLYNRPSGTTDLWMGQQRVTN